MTKESGWQGVGTWQETEAMARPCEEPIITPSSEWAGVDRISPRGLVQNNENSDEGTEGCTTNTRRRVEEAVISAQAHDMGPGHGAQQLTTMDCAKQDHGGAPLRVPTWTGAANQVNHSPAANTPNADSNEKTGVQNPISQSPKVLESEEYVRQPQLPPWATQHR